MTPTATEKKPASFAFHAFMVLFTLIGIPIIIVLPFLLFGFIGRS